MAEARIPASVVVSLGLHGGLLVFFGLMMREGPKQAAKVVEGVDLIVNAPRPKAVEGAPKPPPMSTMDFLKLALPTPTRAAAPAQLSVKLEEHKIKLAEPKLEDRARKDMGPKLQALDMSEHRVEASKLEVKMDRRRATQALAALPRLEEVGRRRVKNLPQAIELEDRRREAVAAQGLPAMDIKAPTRRQAMAAAAALQEAEPAERPSERKGLSSLLEKPMLQEARPQAMSAPKLDKVVAEAPKLQRRHAAAADVAEPKKGVEIEGPLADRKVAAYSVPPFPTWARSQGILEADVAIRFTVDEDGSVMPGMRITSSSGYGRLDKLAMDSLKSWRFVPAPGAGVQWGVITFRFVTE